MQLNKIRHKSIITTHSFIMDGNNVLLLLRSNTGYADGMYGLVTGTVEENETVTEAAIREAHEEAGIIVSPKDLDFRCVLHRPGQLHGYVNFFYLIKKWQGDITNMEPHKCAELAFYPLNDLPDNTIPYIKQAISCFRNGIYFADIVEN